MAATSAPDNPPASTPCENVAGDPPGPTVDAPFDRNELATRTSRGSLWSFVAMVFSQSVLAVQALVLPVFLSPADYGLFGLAFAFVNIGMQLKDISLGLKFVQDRETPRQHAFDVAFTLELMLGAGGAAVIALAAVALGAAYGSDELLWLTLAFAPYAFTGALSLPDFVLQRDFRFASRMVRTILTSVATVTTMLAAAAAGWGVWTFVAGAYVQMLMIVVTLWPVARVRPHLVWDKPLMRKYMRFGWPLWAGSLCLIAFYLIVINVITPLFGKTVGGYFQRTWSMVETSYVVNVMVSTALYPAICNVGTDLALMRRAFQVVNRLMMTVSAPIGFALVFLGPNLVLAWGSDWAGFGPMVQALGTFFILGTLAFDWDNYYRAEGNTKPVFLIAAYMLALLPLFLLFVFLWGQRGIDVAIVLAGAYVYLVRSHYARKLLGQVSALRASWRQIVLAAATGAAGWGVSIAVGGGLGGGVVGLAAFGLLYGASVLVTERRLVAFALNALRGRPTGGLSALIGE